MSISGPVPFASSFYHWIRLHDVTLAQLVNDSRRYEQPYLAWEVVRKNRNPFFDTGTGFEGYYIGRCHSAEEVLNAIIKTSREVLEHIAIGYRLDYGFRSRLMKTLTGEISDPKAIAIWAAEFGAVVARLRCNLHHNREADLFRIETYHLLKSLPNIGYEESDHQVWHHYSVGHQNRNSKLAIGMDTMHPADQDAWLVAWSIGRFGHPFVREYLEYTYGFLPRPYF